MRLTELEIPARAEFVSVARLVISSIAGDRYELTDDQLDNLKLAVSEACVMAIEAQGPSEAPVIALSCEGAADRLDIFVDGHGRDFTEGREPVALQDIEGRDLDRDLGLPLIGSLVDDVAIESAKAGRAQLRMTIFCELAEQL